MQKKDHKTPLSTEETGKHKVCPHWGVARTEDTGSGHSAGLSWGAGRDAGQTRTRRPARGSRQTLASSQSELPGDPTLARGPGLRARPDLGQHLAAVLSTGQACLHLPRPWGRQRTSVTAERGREAHSRRPSWAGRPGGSCPLQAPLEPGLTDICKGLWISSCPKALIYNGFCTTQEWFPWLSPYEIYVT